MSKSPTELSTALAQFQERYYRDPAFFVEEVLGVKPDPWQKDILDMLGGSGKYKKRVRKISCVSGHGVGKSCVASWCLLFHILFRFPQKSICTAPSHSQLHDALGAEVRSWVGKLPDFVQEQLEVLTEQIRFKAAPSESFISFRVSRPESSETIAGVHSDHCLIVADESSGIPDIIFEAGSSSMTSESATTLLLGNPVRSSGFFYDTHHKLSKDWETRVISSLDSKRVSKEFIEEISVRYGRQSNQFRVRCEGKFPLSDEDAIIPRHLVESAVGRDVEPVGGPVIMGVDVARFGSDSSAICLRQGNSILGDGVKTRKGLNTMQVVGWVRSEIEDLKKKKLEIESVNIDVIALGAGVVDRLLEEGIDCRGVNVSEAPSIAGQHLNLRSELWERCREWFEGLDVVIPNDGALIEELCGVRYSFSSTGKQKVESKDEIRRRLGSSPDRADALMLTHSNYASRSKVPWTTSLGREIKGIV